METKYKKIGVVLAIMLVLSYMGISSLAEDLEDMLIQIIGLVLVFSSSVLIALESAKATYLETLKAKHNYEVKQMDNALKGTFRICFSNDAISLKNRKQVIKEKVNSLKKEKVLL